MLPLELHLRQLARTEPALRFRGDMPLEAWRHLAREKLEELLGMDAFVLCDPDFREEESLDKGDCLRTRFSYQSEPGYRVPGYFLRPKNGFARVMIHLQGHSTGLHISLGEAKYPGDAEDIRGGRDIALQAVARGYASLVIEQRCFGECGGRPETGKPNCGQASMAALLLGRTTLAGRVWDVMRAIDMAEEHFSPGAEYCCMGNSGGGTATWYAAALEPRIARAMPSCAVCSYDGSIAPISHCACNYVPQIRRWFDMGDLAGLIAPRPLLVVAGEKDGIFPIGATRETFALIRKYYDAAGAPGACKLHVGAEGHRFYPEAWEEFLAL